MKSNEQALRAALLNELYKLYGVNDKGEHFTFEEGDQYEKAAEAITSLFKDQATDRAVADLTSRIDELDLLLGPLDSVMTQTVDELTIVKRMSKLKAGKLALLSGDKTA